jgi:hypothetical protein
MRRQTRWVFAFLAVVFAGSFVFLGVGSGGSALTDFLNGNIHLFGSGGGPSIKSLEAKVQKNPTDPKARLNLANALQKQSQSDGNQIDPAIAAYKAYLKLKPGDSTTLGVLGPLYASKIANIQSEIQNPPAPAFSDITALAPVDSTSKVAVALAPPAPLSLASLQQGEVVQLQHQFARTVEQHLAVYRQIAAKSPTDSSAFAEVGQIAEQDGATSLALAAYQEWEKKFPTDPLLPSIKTKIKSLEKTLAQAASGSTSATG